jgi:hypothetical protein
VRPDSGKAFYQGGLAGSVFSAERVYFTMSQIKRNLVQCANAGKSLGQLFNLQYYVAIVGH